MYLIFLPLTFLLPLPRHVFPVALSIFAAILLLLLVALLVGVNILRAEVSLVALFILMVAIVVTAQALPISYRTGWVHLAKALKIFINLQILVQFIQIAGLQFPSYLALPHYFLPIVRPPGLLTEPSFVATTFSPIVFASLWPKEKVFGGSMNQWDFFKVYFILILCPSTTAIVMLMLAILLRMVAWQPLLAFVSFAILIAVWKNLLILVELLPPDVADRINVLIYLLQTGYFDQHSNLSSVVLFGGLTAAQTTLHSFPLGVGFLNMASVYNLDSLSYYRQVVGDNNINDGSSMLFKIIAEFGYLGVAFATYGVFAILRYFSVPRPDVTMGLLAFPFLVSFARGGSYLDGPVMIAIAIILFGFNHMEGRRFGRGTPSVLTSYIKS